MQTHLNNTLNHSSENINYLDNDKKSISNEKDDSLKQNNLVSQLVYFGFSPDIFEVLTDSLSLVRQGKQSIEDHNHFFKKEITSKLNGLLVNYHPDKSNHSDSDDYGKVQKIYHLRDGLRTYCRDYLNNTSIPESLVENEKDDSLKQNNLVSQLVYFGFSPDIFEVLTDSLSLVRQGKQSIKEHNHFFKKEITNKLNGLLLNHHPDKSNHSDSGDYAKVQKIYHLRDGLRTYCRDYLENSLIPESLVELDSSNEINEEKLHATQAI